MDGYMITIVGLIAGVVGFGIAMLLKTKSVSDRIKAAENEAYTIMKKCQSAGGTPC